MAARTESAKTKSTKPVPLTDRLKKVHAAPLAKVEMAPVRQSGTVWPEPAPTVAATSARRSVLTPRHIVEQKKDANGGSVVHCRYQIPHDLQDQLPKVLMDASPFSTPLSVVKLIDLIYCEMQNSEALRERLAEQRDRIELGQYCKASTLILQDYVVNYLQTALNASLQKTFSILLSWCVKDWDFISRHVTYKGLKRS